MSVTATSSSSSGDASSSGNESTGYRIFTTSPEIVAQVERGGIPALQAESAQIEPQAVQPGQGVEVVTHGPLLIVQKPVGHQAHSHGFYRRRLDQYPLRRGHIADMIDQLFDHRLQHTARPCAPINVSQALIA